MVVGPWHKSEMICLKTLGFADKFNPVTCERYCTTTRRNSHTILVLRVIQEEKRRVLAEFAEEERRREEALAKQVQSG